MHDVTMNEMFMMIMLGFMFVILGDRDDGRRKMIYVSLFLVSVILCLAG